MNCKRGFTLVEMVVVIAITGIIAGAVALFLRLPVQEYQDAQRRASISDAADTAFRRMSRDLHSALSNSVRVTSVGAVFYLEFLATRTGGRYRVQPPQPAVATSAPTTCPDTDGDGFANENVMQFGVADNCLGTIGPMPAADFAAIVPNSDYLVIYNLGTNYLNANAYVTAGGTGNISQITGVNAGINGENVIQFQAKTFALDSPGHRFQVVSGPVSYVCDPGAGTLSRISGYAIAAAQLTPPAGTTALLANNIAGCTITYTQNAINQRVGVVSIWLSFSDATSNTNANLFQQVDVSTSP